jgi:hypothetical protein
MKKALIVLLILGLAGGLFAQTFSGYVQTGALFTFTGDNPVVAWDDDARPVRANLDFKSAGDDWGVSTSANAGVESDNAPYGITIDGMNGWVNFGGIFTLSAGKGGTGGAWQATTWKDWAFGSGNFGVRLNIKPIDGLSLGLRLGFPNNGVKADKLENFLLETGFGAKYDAGIFVVGTHLKLFSEETGDIPETDATWWLDAKVPLSILTVEFESRFQNLLGKKAAMDKFLGLKLSGSVVGLDWNVWGSTTLADEFDLAAGAGVSYGIPIDDKASAEVGASANLTVLKDSSFDGLNVYADYNYKFTSNVSTYFELGVDGDKDFNLTPTLQWRIKYSF